MSISKFLFDPPQKYRPMPFWSWNDRLAADETKRQVGIMHGAGLGGFFMHARGGLLTEYMGDEWFENIAAGISEGEKREMLPWAYDENGWPSGFGDGKVNALGERYQSKRLMCEQSEGSCPRTITHIGGYHFFYEVNEYYTDNLDKDVVKEFINTAYKPYIDRGLLGLCGFFTDEPQLVREGIPWSNVIPRAYKEEYDEDLIPKLNELFFETGSYKKTRIKYWRLVTKLFAEAYFKQIYEYLDKRGMKLTGHVLLEDDLLSQLTTNGAVMPMYEYFHIPGIDALFREPVSKMTVLQVSSVAHQLGKKQVISESFGASGDSISFEDMRYLYEYQMVRGVNLLCPHLEGYSLRGMRKFDRPPAMYYQQPWWSKYYVFNDMVSSVGMLLAEGRTDFNTLLIHPQTSAWALFNTRNCDEIRKLSDSFEKVIDCLEEKHILFDLGDELLMEKYAYVKDGRLVIGKEEYEQVILPPHTELFENTKRLLDDFVKCGGRVVSWQDVKESDVTDNKYITYTRRNFDGFTMHYFVNSTDAWQNAKFNISGMRVDFLGKRLAEFENEYKFAPHDSLVIIEDGNERSCKERSITYKKKITADGSWEIAEISPNALVIDKCDYYIDNVLMGENEYIMDAQTAALEMKKPVMLDIRYKFDITDIPESIFLVTENDDAEIYVNGHELKSKPCGYFIDPCMKKIDISGFVKKGVNVIRLEMLFKQRGETYINIERSKAFEGEKNKLSLDMELSAAYVIGDFEVSTQDECFAELKDGAVRYSGGFSITAQQKELPLTALHMSGYPFFAGQITVKKEFYADDPDYILELSPQGINAADIYVNGSFVKTMMWSPFTADLSGFLNKGKNELKITLYNNLRNLMGPHHLQEGECRRVRPGCYFKRKWLFHCDDIIWNDGYCFIKTSVS